MNLREQRLMLTQTNSVLSMAGDIARLIAELRNANKGIKRLRHRLERVKKENAILHEENQMLLRSLHQPGAKQA